MRESEREIVRERSARKENIHHPMHLIFLHYEESRAKIRTQIKIKIIGRAKIKIKNIYLKNKIIKKNENKKNKSQKNLPTCTKKFSSARNMAIFEEKNLTSTISRNLPAPKGAQEGWTAIVRGPRILFNVIRGGLRVRAN